jgi:hypothetical protein
MSDEERDDRNEHDSPREGDLLRWAEKSQRTIDFMLQQQARYQAQSEARQAESHAKSEADMQSLRELQRQNEERWRRTSEEIRALLAIAEIHEREIFKLGETQAEARARTDAQMAETGERVNALVKTVERLISERRNGGRGEENSE